jgi:hypothetical protein
MILELYGIDEDEREFRKSFKKLKAVRIWCTCIEVVNANSTTDIVAHGYLNSDGDMCWRTEPMHKFGRLNPNYEDLPEYSGLNIIS